MFWNRIASWVFLALAAVSVGCKQSLPSAGTENVVAHSVRASTRNRQPDAPKPESSLSSTPQAVQAGMVAGQAPKAEDLEERKGPFTIMGQTFTVVLRSKHLPGKKDDFGQTLTALEIVDAGGAVQHREEFPIAVENGEFTESCSVIVNPISGSNGSGLLLGTMCLPSAPLSGGPWQIFGLINGKLSPIGKPLYAEGELGDFVRGKINRIGNLTQILADELRIRLFTGYFFVSVPVRVNWMEGKLALAQHCFYQTGHGMAEGGCEMPAEDVERVPSEQELSFVRMFSESNEQAGTPAHVVVKKSSQVEILAAKVLVKWEEGEKAIGLGVGGDIWVKVRIDGKEGWIHTDEDLQAVGLYRAG
jgi:hypothetical protein